MTPTQEGLRVILERLRAVSSRPTEPMPFPTQPYLFNFKEGLTYGIPPVEPYKPVKMIDERSSHE